MIWPFGLFNRTDEDGSEPEDLMVIVDPSLDSRLVVYHEPRSFPAEQFRAFRTNLRAMNPEDAPRSLLFTSSAPDEGKSTTVANIAVSLGEFEQLRVCLVDMDLRGPRIHELFGLPRGPGITDILLDRANPADAIQPSGLPNLRVLTAGRPTDKPSEVISSDHIQDLIAYLKRDYNYILFDTPPCAMFADASHLSKVMDGVIVVVALGETQRRDVDDVLEVLDAAGANVVGTFVTGTSTEEPTVVVDVEEV